MYILFAHDAYHVTQHQEHHQAAPAQAAHHTTLSPAPHHPAQQKEQAQHASTID